MQAILNYIDMNAELDAATYSPYMERIDKIITDVVTIARARQRRCENDGENTGE